MRSERSSGAVRLNTDRKKTQSLWKRFWRNLADAVFGCFLAFALCILCLPIFSSNNYSFTPFRCLVISLGCVIWGYSVHWEQRQCYHLDPLFPRDSYNFPKSISLNMEMSGIVPSAPQERELWLSQFWSSKSHGTPPPTLFSLHFTIFIKSLLCANSGLD